MSEIKVNSIKGVGASTAAITVDNTAGTCTANISSVNGGQLSNRRLNINGGMTVAQRGTVTGITSSQYAGPDRFRFGLASHGTFTVSQDTSVPTGSGFSNSLKLACTTADTSVAASAKGYFQHKFEGQDCQLIRKGTSSAKQLAVQFWVKSNKTGNYAFQLKDEDNVRSFTTTYTISSADTWEQKKITIPADTTGVLGNDNNASLTFTFWLVAGTDSTSGSASTSWYGNVAANLAVGHNVNIADSTSNTWYMTGFQVETGSVHTDFEHRSYADEIRLCRRYFCKYVGALNINFVNEHPNNTAGYLHFPFYEEMRASPTITLGNSVNIARPQVSVSQKVQSVADISPNCFNVIGWSGQGSLGSTGDSYYRMSLSEGDANSTISCNAEL